MGTGPLNVVKSLSIMGLGVDQSHERSFYRYMKTINLKIISSCDDIIEESLIVEVSTTMKAVSDNQDLTPDEINAFSNIKNVKKIDNINLTHLFDLLLRYGMEQEIRRMNIRFSLRT